MDWSELTGIGTWILTVGDSWTVGSCRIITLGGRVYKQLVDWEPFQSMRKLLQERMQQSMPNVQPDHISPLAEQLRPNRLLQAVV